MGTGEICAAFNAFAGMGIFRRQAANAWGERKLWGPAAREWDAVAPLVLWGIFAFVDAVAHAFFSVTFPSPNGSLAAAAENGAPRRGGRQREHGSTTN
jgi:hypothetical protein